MAPTNAGFLKRLAALVYDFLLATSIVVISHLVLSVVLIAAAYAGAVPLQHYQEGLVGYLAAHRAAHLLFLLCCVASFFLWFWTHGGQTLGMKAWRLRLQNQDGSPIHMRQAVVRLCFAFAGLGNLMILINPRQKLALQDKLSDSIVVQLSKTENGPLRRR